MGAWSLSTPRSDRMMMEYPSSTARAARSHNSSMARFSEPSPTRTSNRAGMVMVLMPSTSRALIFSSSALVTTGSFSLSWRQCSGVSSNRLRCRPTKLMVEVTSSSRIASRGGLVTCANICLK